MSQDILNMNIGNKKHVVTMYNRNYGVFDYVRIHSELLRSVLYRKLTHIKSVTDSYTRPLAIIGEMTYQNQKLNR